MSRFGLVAYASSLDVIGVTATDVATARVAFETMRGVDQLDQSSVDYPPLESEPPPPARDQLVVGIPNGILEGLDPAVRGALDAAATGCGRRASAALPWSSARWNTWYPPTT